MAQSLAEIAAARQLYEDRLLKDPNIVGVSSGFKTVGGRPTGEPALIIYVVSKIPASSLATSYLLPRRVSFYHAAEAKMMEVPTDVVETGRISALAYTGRYRPAPGGVSIGHRGATSGTLGGYVLDRKTGELLLLSNNHVLANANNCLAGDPIFQQGPLDGGAEGDALATLANWIPLDFSPSGANLVDAAVARPADPALAELVVLGLGPGPNAVTPAQIGMGVQKSGRTTERTAGARVTSVDATFWVEYDGGTRRARFRDAIVLWGPPGFCQSGDSGSFLFTDEPDPRLTGLLFAANGSGTFALANHIYHVFNLLDVGLVSAPAELIRETPWRERLADLRVLRDEVLPALGQGRRFLTLLARHNAELWCILHRYPHIRAEAMRLATPLLEALCAAAQPQAISFGRAYFLQVRALLDRMEPLSSLPLRKSIAWLRSELPRYEDKDIVEIMREMKKAPPVRPAAPRRLPRYEAARCASFQ